MEQAQRDCDSIVALLARELNRTRIYQWGSLVHTSHFSEASDIDIAVEGVTDTARFYQMSAKVQALTRFDVDLVEIESMHPAYAEHVRRRGRIVYERGT